MSIDATDRRILTLLQENARIPAAEIARVIDMAPSAVHQRIRKLEESGVILGYETRLDARAVNRGLVAYIRVRAGEAAHAHQITEVLTAIPEVQEVHRVVGEDCFFVKVRVSDSQALADLLDDELQRIPGVASTHTTIVLTTAKETTRMTLNEPEDSDRDRPRSPPTLTLSHDSWTT
jgi:Lrp/AsnC family transcriptional regulator, leucine-responsive regulatory protein